MLADQQAQIDELSVQMKAEAKAAGRAFPENWRHPGQDNLDALGALLARAKAVKAKK